MISALSPSSMLSKFGKPGNVSSTNFPDIFTLFESYFKQEGCFFSLLEELTFLLLTVFMTEDISFFILNKSESENV